MCGRFTNAASGEQVADYFHAPPARGVKLWSRPRYNIAPTQPVAVVRVGGGGAGGVGRSLDLLRWGLVPGWAKDVSVGNRMINARAETAGVKPSFRAAIKRRRCLIPADGFYEWRRADDGGKQPYYITVGDEGGGGCGGLFAFAGLWEHWQDGQGNELESCAILTTGANEMMSVIHDRMPVIIRQGDYDRWLDPSADRYEAVADLLVGYPSELMSAKRVSRFVNSPKHDDVRCVQGVGGHEPGI